MPPATCLLLTSTTTASARWTPTASSPPWRAMAAQPASGTAARPPTPACIYPSGVAFDAFGNLLLLTTTINRIRKVDTNGIITTVAGNGTATYSGDGGAATNASLNFPSAWPSMPPATCILLTPKTIASARCCFSRVSHIHAQQHRGDQCRQLHGGHLQPLRQRDQRGCDPDRGSAGHHHQTTGQPASGNGKQPQFFSGSYRLRTIWL